MSPNRLTPVTLRLLVVLHLAACGGGSTDPQPKPGPAPVADVRVDPSSSTLAPGQQQQLNATLRDSAGAVIIGRTVAWRSSDPTSASVTNAGLVTAHAAGNVTISASSEGHTGTASVVVSGPGAIGVNGGSTVLAGGAVTITVPPGALSAPLFLTAAVKPQSATPPDKWQILGSTYSIGPAGTTFSKPVTVTIKYAITDLPAFTMSGDLSVLHFSAGAWSGLTDIVVDTVSMTVSGRTTSFSDFAVAAVDPAVRLSPQRASVNMQQRSVTIFAIIPASGGSVPLPPGTPPLRYRWWTTGNNGALDKNPSQWTVETEALYTATNPVLNQISGPIDTVYAEVLLNPEALSTGEPKRTVIVQAVVDADLAATYEVTPNGAKIGRGSSLDLQLLIRNKQGSVLPLPPDVHVWWTTSGTYGSIPTGLGPLQTGVTYTALRQFPVPPPRIDNVVATVWKLSSVVGRNPRTVAGMVVAWQEFTRVDSAIATTPTASIEVKVPYQVTLTSSSNKVTTQGTAALEVKLSPDDTGPGIMFKYQVSGTWGSISVPLGVPTDITQFTYTGGPVGGGSDVITVEAVSVIQGVERAVLAQAQVSIEVSGPAAFTEISTANGGLHTCAIDANGQAWCWGWNDRGQLGDGTQLRSTRPVRVNTGVRFTSITAGWKHTCALTTTGAAWCWGNHTYGETGDGGPYGPQYPPRLTPVAVQGPPFVEISAGGWTTCGVTVARQVYCWGNNGHTQVGDGTSENRPAPVLVLSGAGHVKVGSFQACATSDPDGITWCWGDNGKDATGSNVDYSPQIWGKNLLGTGLTQRQIYSPTAVPGAAFHNVAVGTGFSCGWTVTGEVSCGGLNYYGQLGDGTTTWRSARKPIKGGLTFTQVSTGAFHACGISLIKEIWCWGSNGLGQLGTVTGTPQATPILVAAPGVQFTRVSAGSSSTCAISTKGEAWCWGGNTQGQLGDGTLVSRSTPVVVKP